MGFRTALALALLAATPAVGVAQFTEVGGTIGLDTNAVKDGAGASFGDFDNDGFLDILFSVNGQSFLFINDGNAMPRFTDATGERAAGLSR
ncbi:MAG: hypothetical protein AAGF12_18755, partial [Myxococcota bacterium]